MELKFLLALLFLLYVLPELFRKKKKKYEYPDIPSKAPEPLPEKSSTNIKALPSLETSSLSIPATPIKQVPTMPPPVIVPHTSSEFSPWDGKIESSFVLNGVIFAEILQPPRAIRPIHARPARRRP